MFSIHSSGELPGIFLIKGIANNDLSSSIGSTLLEVVTISDSIIIMAGTTCFLGTVRDFTFDGEGISVKPLQNDLLMQ